MTFATEIKPGHLHGSCVDFSGKAILLIGGSGTGKTSLALDLIALGGILISDDQVILSHNKDQMIATAPLPLKNKIELRQIGILSCPCIKSSSVNLIVDLDHTASKRMPKRNFINFETVQIDAIAGKNVPNLPMAAMLLNLYGWAEE